MSYDIKESKILIVDDLPENLQVLGTALSKNNFRVAFATSGKQAISIALSKKPDLILLDIQMPEMDGYETCENLKGNPETTDIPIIFLTAKSEIDDIVKGFKTGAVDYIRKPFNHSELIARVTTHLELKLAKDFIKIQNDELISSQQKIAQEAQKVIELNEDLMEREFKLKELIDLKDKFFSIIAHDLRGPFAALFGLSELLHTQASILDEKDLQQIHENIYHSSRKVFSLVENLLQWARSQMGRLEFELQRNNIHDLVRKEISYLKDIARSKSISVDNQIPDNMYALFDYNTISTVIRNLVSNALKFTNHNGEVILNAEVKDKYIEILVKDNGVGMPLEATEKIFRLDAKYSTSGTDDEPGTGLGLILCKDFVEKNGGKIWVDSKENLGTEFYFTLQAK